MEVADLNDIRIFAVVGQEGTLTSAAGKLKLPTSTVSRALTRLEKSLGVLLIRRSSRGLVLTDFGRDYLQVCRRALRTLNEGGETLVATRERPAGLLKIACPSTMGRFIFAPLLNEFLERYPDLRVEIEPYAPGGDHESRDDVDILFKVRVPRDSIRRLRPYPGVRRGLFASAGYIKASGTPARPEDLLSHTCIGHGPWKLSRGNQTISPNIQFRVAIMDPMALMELTLKHFGIAVLPVYMAKWPEAANNLVSVLPRWNLPSLTLCAIFSGQSHLTPKVRVMLDFLGEYIGTARDPRLHGCDSKGIFTD
ncbi:LysR family transcriptional regulator [Granulicella sibirica]|nr:LysR family transcriptional regulator [Granulicella sibirica]